MMLVTLTYASNVEATSLLSCGIKNVEKAEIIDCSNIKKIDYKVLSKAKNVRILSLKNTNLKTIPTEIYGLTNLESLNLEKNNLSKVDSDIKKLTKLKRLVLSNNIFEVFPSELTKLKNLTHLDLSYNGLVTVDNSVKDLRKLKVLLLNDNSINSIAPLNNLTKLKTLNLNNNLLVKLPNLDSLSIDNLLLENNILKVKEVKTKNNTYQVNNQNKIEAINNNYLIDSIFYNKENLIIQGTELTNSKKAVGFKEYNFINLRDAKTKKKVKLSDYVDKNNNYVIKAGKVIADIKFIAHQEGSYLIKNVADIEFLNPVVTNGNNNGGSGSNNGNNNGSGNNDDVGNVNDSSKESKETGDKNTNTDKTTLQDNIYQSILDKMLIGDSANNYLFLRLIGLSLLAFLFFILPCIIIIFLIRKMKKSIDSLSEL